MGKRGHWVQVKLVSSSTTLITQGRKCSGRAVDEASIKNFEQVKKIDWDNELYVFNDYEYTNIRNICYMLKEIKETYYAILTSRHYNA